MHSEVCVKSAKVQFYLGCKAMPHLYQGLHLDMRGLEKVKQLSQDSQNRIVFMPIYKSNVDIAVMHYANYYSELELGFSFGHFDTSSWTNFKMKRLKSIGLIPVKKYDSETVVQQLLSAVIENNQFTTVYQNDEMLKEGKLSLPASDDKMVKYLLASYPRLQMLKRNVKIIPVTINYERFLADKDLDTSGSFFTILQQLKNVPLMSLGNIFVNYGAPVDLHTYVQESQSKSLEDVSLSLTQDLYKM